MIPGHPTLLTRFFILMPALALTAPPSLAGRYELLEGKGVEVCEAYQENLNSFKPTLPMVCQRSVNPQLKNFSKPDWQRIDATTGVIEKIDEFLWKRDANPIYYVSYFMSPANWRGTREQYAKAKQGYLAGRSGRFVIGHLVGEIDIDNDGTLDDVYLDRACGAFGALLLVLNSDRTDIDRAKTALVMRHPSRAKQGLRELRPLAPGEVAMPQMKNSGYTMVEDALHWAFYDVFRYKDKNYFDVWWNKHPDFVGKPAHDVGRLRVYLTESRRVRETCSYRFMLD